MNSINLTEDKLQYLKEHNFIKFDKEEIRKELKVKNYSDEHIETLLKKFTYYRMMPCGEKMYYSTDYLSSNSIQKINEQWEKITEQL